MHRANDQPAGRHTASRFWAAALSGVLWTSILTGAASPPLPASDLETEVDAQVRPYLETGNFAGAVLAGRGDEVVFAKAYGQADIELGVSNSIDTVFHLASTSKPFTTAAILLLERDGKLSVRDPLARFVPEFPRADRIQLHHLMINSTGIPNINARPEYDALSLAPQTPESLMEAFRDLRPEFKPGERYGYSNSNYNLLALVIERASGMSYGEFLEQRIFQPLGMTSSGHHGDVNRIIPRRAEGYSPVGLAALERAPHLDWSVKTGNGSLYSTVGDLFRFARAIMTGRLLTEEQVRRMHTAHIGNAGYGWFLRPRHGHRQVHINGRSPGFTSYLGLYPEDDLVVIVLGNVYNSAADSIGEAIGGLLLGKAITPPSYSRRGLSPDQVRAAVGRYRFDDTFYNPNWIMEVIAADQHLFVQGHWLIPSSDDGTLFVHRRYWSDIEFTGLEEGRYSRVRFDDFVGHRLDDESAAEAD